MIPASAPSRVLDRLRAAPDGPVPVVHRGRDAVYVDVAGRCVGVVGPRATAVPCALRITLERLDLGATRSARVEGGVLHLDDDPLAVGRLVDVQVPRLTTTAERPAPAPGDVADMVGRGGGLTPYDDDVLCGWIATHRAAGVSTPEVDAAVRSAAHRTTLLSATLLDCAMHGEVVPEFASWLASPRDEGRTARLVAVGHTSGRGLLEGGRSALRHLAPALLDEEAA